MKFRVNNLAIRGWIILYTIAIAVGILVSLFIHKMFKFINPIYFEALIYLSLFISIAILAFKKPWRNSDACVGEDGLLEQKGIVLEECRPVGQVKLINELWKAQSMNGEIIAKGEMIVVRRIEGLCLIVEKSEGSVNTSPA